MKKRVPIVSALSALALVGCACPLFFVPPPPNKPQVSVVDGRFIVVSPEPLMFRVGDKAEEIVWSLPRSSNYRFPSNGIVIEGQVVEVREPAAAQTTGQTVLKRIDVKPQTDIICPPQEGGLTFRCTNNKKTRGYFKYTIRVNDGKTDLNPIDPMIGNDI
jgi:hypothetical protein